MKRSIPLLAAALAIALAGCNDTNNNDADAPDTSAATGMDAADTGDAAADATASDAMGDAPGAMPADAMATADGAGAPADRKALMAVMEVDRHEIASAEAALAKNVEGDARSYAETLRDDHSRNLDATQGLMGSAAGTAGASTDAMGDNSAMAADDPELAAMKQKHDAERERLAALEGEAFTIAWVDAMAKGHEEALGKLDNQLIPGASDAAVRTHLENTRTAIARHLETARSLQQEDAN